MKTSILLTTAACGTFFMTALLSRIWKWRAMLTFFAIAVATYLMLGYQDRTDNQFSERNFGTTTGMVLLVAAEVGGFAVLFAGFLATQL